MRDTIKALTKQIRGVSYKPTDLRGKNLGIPLLRANNIEGDGLNFNNLVFVSSDKVNKDQFLRNGDIVICASSGSKSLVGKSGVYHGPNDVYTFGAFCKVIRPIKPENQDYLGLFFQSPNYRALISEKAKGANINNLKSDDLDSLSFKDYPTEIKRKIVQELFSYLSCINSKKQELICLDSLVKSRFIEMFGDVLRNSKGFETCCFGEYVNQMNIGPFGSDLKNDSFVPKERAYCMVYEQKHAIEKTLNVPTRYVGEDKFKKLSRFEVGPGDIIVSCRGTVGECWMLPEGAPRGIIHPSLMMIKPKDSVNHGFLVFLLERVLSEQTQDGSGVKMAIQAKQLAKINVIKPSLDLQNLFMNFVSQVDKSEFVVRKQIKDLQELLDSKMDEYFGGEEE